MVAGGGNHRKADLMVASLRLQGNSRRSAAAFVLPRCLCPVLWAAKSCLDSLGEIAALSVAMPVDNSALSIPSPFA